MKLPKIDEYDDFLQHKALYTIPSGFDPDPATKFSPLTFDWQWDVASWALRRGRGALFLDCGLGKTVIELEWGRQVHVKTKKPILTFTPLAVADQMVREGEKFGIPIVHAEEYADLKEFSATNYQRMHRFPNPEKFGGLILDESGILKSQDGKTRNALIAYARHIPYRLCATATPSPNDFIELGNHAEFLDIMTRAEMLATFFTHDGGETSKWRLKGHAKKVFWNWVSSWAIAMRKPSDLGYSDDGFVLPPLTIKPVVIEDDFRVRGCLISTEASTLDERRLARRQSLPQSVAECARLVANDPKSPWLIWCNLNSEGDALAATISGAVQVSGKDSDTTKEKVLADFSCGRVKYLITKPSIAGFGMNWQHCHNVVFVGLSDSYEQFYQAVRRCWRFGQRKSVTVYVITAGSEGAVVRNIKRKEQQASEMMDGIVTDMKSEMRKNLHQASHQSAEYKTGCVKEENKFEAHLGDCVDVLRKQPSNSIGFSIFSPPFSSLYTYTSSLRDMGNCRSDQEFFSHYKFMVDELLRVMTPGRLVAIHCANLTILKSQKGYIGLRDFRGEMIWLMEQHGFILHSEIIIRKDPLVAMQRTKALTLLHKQLVKDSALSGQALPDFIIVFRKPGINPDPITHKPSGFERYIGATPLNVAKNPHPAKNKFSHEVWQRYADPIWMDINQSDTLQFRAAREKEDERHICPLQLPVVERCLELWSNPGDIVLSPFMGIGTEGYVALRAKRRFLGVELKESYWNMAVKNLKFASTHSKRKPLI